MNVKVRIYEVEKEYSYHLEVSKETANDILIIAKLTNKKIRVFNDTHFTIYEYDNSVLKYICDYVAD